MTRFPAGYLVLGDALCSFNPIYAQGMSVAALEAVELDKALAGDSRNLAKAFFGRAARLLDTPWSIAVDNDLRMPETEGRRTLGVRFINWYITKLHRAAQTDPVLSLAFHKVSNLLAPPPSLINPRVALRVLLAHLSSSWLGQPRQTGLRAHQRGTTS